jgi:hypothetical protein
VRAPANLSSVRAVVLGLLSCTSVSAMPAPPSEESAAVWDHSPPPDGGGYYVDAPTPVAAGVSQRSCKGIKENIRIPPVISGLTFRHQLNKTPRPLWVDCTFASHLEQAAEIMKSRGVTEVIHLGTYAPKTTTSGSVSAHALGMAIDIAAFVVNGETITIEKDFVLRTSPKIETCRAPRVGPRDHFLKSLVCALDGPFNAILTPNWDETHRTHFHLAWHTPSTAPWANSVDPIIE